MYGSRVEELTPFLFATYMYHTPIEQDHPKYACDGATLTTFTDGRVVVRLCISKEPIDVEARP